MVIVLMSLYLSLEKHEDIDVNVSHFRFLLSHGIYLSSNTKKSSIRTRSFMCYLLLLILANKI